MYHDQRLLDYLEFGFPLGYIAMEPPEQNTRNHASSTNYPSHVDNYLSKELANGSLRGPFKDKPTDKTHMNPIMSRPKKASTSCRIILDLSYAPNNQSVITGITQMCVGRRVCENDLANPTTPGERIALIGSYVSIPATGS